MAPNAEMKQIVMEAKDNFPFLAVIFTSVLFMLVSFLFIKACTLF